MGINMPMCIWTKQSVKFSMKSTKTKKNAQKCLKATLRFWNENIAIIAGRAVNNDEKTTHTNKQTHPSQKIISY